MSNRNYRTGSRYNRRGGSRYINRPESNRGPIDGDGIDSLMPLMDRHLTTNENSTRGSFSKENRTKITRDSRLTRTIRPFTPVQNNRTDWWSITIPQAGTIGKERVMSTLKTHFTRHFQPYHYHIDRKSMAGVFFVNNQHDADMLKRANGKIEVQNLDILRIIVGRVARPMPLMDEDLRPHFKDYLVNRRFNQQTFQLDLTNLAADEELSNLGIFPQFNTHAFIRDVVDIINKDLHMTRQLDLGSNNIVNLQEFRYLHLENLVQLSLASNKLRNIDDFANLKQLPQLARILIKNNPLLSQNNRRTESTDDIISTIHQKIPQLKRIDDNDLQPIIVFAADIETINLPKSLPHCVPQGEIQKFLTTFIDQFYRLFDARGRAELHACYHDSCMFSLCVTTPPENPLVPTRQYKYGSLISNSRNLKKVFNDNKRSSLLRHGKMMVLKYLIEEFPFTEHDGNSFHVDVISTANNRAIFTVNGLFREKDQGINGPVRCFQRTFTCSQTSVGVLIIADHIMLTNATDTQVLNMTPPSTTPNINNQNYPNTSADVQNQMVQTFAQASGMNIEYSKLCLTQHNWNYDKAAEVFLDLKNHNQIPPEAFNRS